MNQSDVQQQAQQEDRPSFTQDAAANHTNNQPDGLEPPFRPHVQSPMASLNLTEATSSRSHRSSQYSFTSQDAAQSISYELTKTGSCTFNDVASKVRSE